MLRAARERQGLHVAALAAAIKVAPRKLELLEADRWTDLPDATFIRALALTVCRTLKLDPAPVLQGLPRPEAAALDHVSGTLNAPFREHASRDEPGLAAMAIRPMFAASAVLMVAAVALYFLPAGWWQGPAAEPPAMADAPPAVAGEPRPAEAPQGPALAADAAANAVPPLGTAGPGLAPSAPGTPVVVTLPGAPAAGSADAALLPVPLPGLVATPPVASVPTAPAGVVPSAPAAVLPPTAPAMVPAAAPSGSAALQLRTRESSWIEVRDANDRVLFSRIVAPGEAVGVDGAPPLRVTVGNAGVTDLNWRGTPVDLAPLARDRVARLTLR
jgi:cytoskeleton protein RodZ